MIARTPHRAGTLLSGAVFALFSLCLTVSAAQAQIPVHPHGPGFTTWERDGNIGAGISVHGHPAPAGESGDEAHQHYSADDLGGFGDETGPFSFFGAWRDRTGLVQAGSDFTSQPFYNANRVGHSFINPNMQPRWRFDGANWGTDANAMAAAPLIQTAFGLWSNISAEVSPVSGASLLTGFGFSFTTGNVSEIVVRWADIPDASGGGRVLTRATSGEHTSANPVVLELDSSFLWDFNQNPGVSDLDRWHLFSVALHEVGHVAFMEHVPGQSNHLMAPPVGAPLDAPFGSESYRWGGFTDNPGENDFWTGTLFTRLGPGIATTAITDSDSVVGIKAMYSVTVAPEPGTIFLLLGVTIPGAGLAIRRRLHVTVRYSWSNR